MRQRHLTEVLGAIATVTCGREGPVRALEVFERVARSAAETHEAQSFGWPVLLAAAFHFLRGDVAGSRRWIDVFAERARVDQGVLRLGSSEPSWIAAALASHFSLPDLLEGLSSHPPRDARELALHEADLAIGQGIAARDAAATSAALERLYASWEDGGIGALPHPLILCAHVLAAAGPRPDETWHAPLARAREFSERAGAAWALAEIERIETEIAGRR
ncbi:MAG: hypothetical protein ACRDGT_02985 [Candidatus Limnocylindria bacterium]